MANSLTERNLLKWYIHRVDLSVFLLEIIHLLHTQMYVCKCTCGYQGVRNVSFSENVAYILNE